MTRSIIHHAALPHRGGAVRIARLLMEAQKAAGVETRLTFEVAENDPDNLDAPPAEPTPLPELARAFAALPMDGVLHLHTSADWPALLAAIMPHVGSRRVLLTLHDATPLTGGCAYPLDCPHFPACADPCPRQFPRARKRQHDTLALLRRLGPILASPSSWLAGLARKVLPGLILRVIPNGVPWAQLADLPLRNQARATLGIDPHIPMALFAAHGGARAAYKSGPLWTGYWQTLSARLPEARGFAVGGDEASSENGLTVWPYLDRGRLTVLMRAADALLYPTLADNHPLVLLEAASMELPVASYNVGGVPEIVVNATTGLLVPPGDSDAFAQAALKLLRDQPYARRMGRDARSHGAGRFGVERMAREYKELMD
jgi:glycosyltransferase involved in cell wall biosynthesis